jgi:uncharacterized membrane protein
MLSEPSGYLSAAKDSLAKANKPGRVILIHTGAVLLLSLLMMGVDYFLDQQISTTGGLSGMGLRSILTTIQSSLRLFQFILLPFWQIGYTYYTLRIAQGENADIPDLFQGFRRFGPILRLKLLFAGITFLLIMACSYISSFLFTLTPWAAPLIQDLETLMGGTLDETALMNAVYSMSPKAFIPIMTIFCLCFLAGGIFLFFRFRLAELWLMDHPGKGALAALRSSRMAMHGNFKAMLKIDLSFWWFYLLEVIVTALCFGDLILGAIGLEMTTDAFSHYLVFYSLYVWAQMALYWWKRNEVCVTYAHAYMALCPKEIEEEPTKV